MSHSSNHSDAAAPGLTGYLTGFVLAMLLTLIPFGLVAFNWLSKGTTLIAVAAAAVIQIIVHLVFFLHLDLSPEHRWNTASGVFAALIMFVLVGGTVWLFYSLDYRTMVPGG